MTRLRHPVRRAYQGPPRSLPSRIPEPLGAYLRALVAAGVTPDTLTDEHRELAHIAYQLTTTGA